MWLPRRRTERRHPEAERAVQQSTRRLEEAKAQTPEIASLMDALKAYREQNHFREALIEHLQGRT